MALQGQKTFDSVLIGSTSVSSYVMLENANGTPATGLAHNTSGLSVYSFRLDTGPSQVALVPQTSSGAWTSGGFCEMDATNAPGVYRVDLPNALFATGSQTIGLSVKGTGIKTSTTTGWLVRGRKVYGQVGTSPTRFVIRLTGATVGTGQLVRRQLQVLTGAAKHERVTIVECASNGDLILSPPLTVAPTQGDEVVVL